MTSDTVSAVAPTTGVPPRPRITVETDDDPTPMVRLIARTIRDSAGSKDLADRLVSMRGTAVIRSHDTPQCSTIRLRGDRVSVEVGAAVDTDVDVRVDLNDRFGIVDAPAAELSGLEGADALLEALQRVLRPPLPPWREAAERFWLQTRDRVGMPERLVVVCNPGPQAEELTLGSGTVGYTIAADAETLARILTGTDDLLAAVFAGSVTVRGTLPQLSVMAGASWKVRFDVF